MPFWACEYLRDGCLMFLYGGSEMYGYSIWPKLGLGPNFSWNLHVSQSITWLETESGTWYVLCLKRQLSVAWKRRGNIISGSDIVSYVMWMQEQCWLALARCWYEVWFSLDVKCIFLEITFGKFHVGLNQKLHQTFRKTSTWGEIELASQVTWKWTIKTLPTGWT